MGKAQGVDVRGTKRQVRELVYIGAGKVEWQKAAEPTLQGPGEALVRPLAVARCDLDAAMMMGIAPYQGPFALGHEFVGEVVEVGEEVRFRPGQRVIVSFQVCCGECSTVLARVHGELPRGAAGSDVRDRATGRTLGRSAVGSGASAVRERDDGGAAGRDRRRRMSPASATTFATAGVRLGHSWLHGRERRC